MWAKLTGPKLVVGLLLAAVLAVALACGGAEEAVPAAPAAQVQPTPTFPPTVIPPAISTPEPAVAPAPVVAEGGKYGGHLRMAVHNETFPPKWDFSQTTTWVSLAQYGRHYSGLLQFSPRDGIEIWPDMAKSWEVSGDGLTYTFDIDERLKEWHDGTSFDVNHIIFAFNRWKSPPEGIIQPRVGAFRLIESMDKLDEHTLSITLGEPFGDFIAEAANAWHKVIPQHILEANNNNITSAALTIGTGPFMYEASEEGVSVTSVRNPDYFRTDPDGNQYPYMDKVTTIKIPEKESIIAALRAKQLDAAKQVPGAVIAFQKIVEDFPGEATFSLVPFVDIASIQLNNTAPPFDDINARRAVFYGVNKSRIIEFLGAEQPVNPISWFSTLFPSKEEILSLPGYNDATRDQDVAKAAEFARMAGLEEFELVVPTFRVGDAELLTQDMEECCGIKVTIRPQDWTSMIAVVEGRRYDAAMGGTAPSYAGVIPVADIMYTPGGGRNGGWDAPANWLAAWNEARTLQPGPDRDKQFAEMHRIMREEWVPTVPYYGISNYKFNWNYLHNLNVVAQEIFSNNKYEDHWLDSNAPTR